MAEIEFSQEQIDHIVYKLKQYFADELGSEIGQFEAEFFLAFISKEFGGYYYNKGLDDAHAVMVEKMADVADTLYAIEKPVAVR